MDEISHWLVGGGGAGVSQEVVVRVFNISKAPSRIPSPLSTPRGARASVFALPVSQLLTHSCQRC